MKTKYRDIRLSDSNRSRLAMVNSIVQEYQGQGLVLTLRQLYYQLVSRDVIPNRSDEYNKLSKLLKEGRMAGIVDWEAIEDRLRVPKKPSSFDSPEDILRVAANQFAMPRMQGQETYIEVWVEKDALSGVLSRVTMPYHIPILVNRGYSSTTAMHDAFERFKQAECKRIRVLYLGDFDPSGVDMLRDVEARVREFFIGSVNGFDKWSVTRTFPSGKKKSIKLGRSPDLWEKVCREKLGVDFRVIPVALTREQIEEYTPPPNPAKRTDSRYRKFEEAHGDTSWEVDALRPEILNQILTDAIEELIDRDKYDKILEEEEDGREKLHSLRKYLE